MWGVPRQSAMRSRDWQQRPRDPVVPVWRWEALSPRRVPPDTTGRRVSPLGASADPMPSPPRAAWLWQPPEDSQPAATGHRESVEKDSAWIPERLDDASPPA